MNRQLESQWQRLQASAFRAKFHLNVKDQAYLQNKGLPLILSHARDFVDRRLAPAWPKNDGKQTPMRGHPAFVAQHATATCCRGCLAKWHGIPPGVELDEPQRQYIVQLIGLWLVRKAGAQAEEHANPFDPDRAL
ncbi:DUF4186 domain-containing protein [Serratia odorifera]|jgi:hypothetical protein|uniref:DUF4186 domain-containing protein n=2 Tax=Serratia odorifera TaxID=618 RepID=D4E3T6_SEROD|nr:DUF4186 domain-containing protein [Serratia odorifera]EFE95634.1 hypothetical protein HMPREF0758_2836 [Serratia odorifera DSM 4582]MBJ2065940.1 DUF4186 domain-containing protein [Serratia odorifera]PNK90213.1 DUF4186 domain-containing protein [Serratia odorifera]RII71346.1 DUF4186 domain-containing protein [Serratia odorifera]VDZ60485.1 Uncharacterised protein [Serratia odorifera]